MIARAYLNAQYGEAERPPLIVLFIPPRARRPNHMQQSSILAKHVTRWNVVRQSCC